MTKPAFNPSHIASRLEAVTNVASARITKLTADVEWYQRALEEKSRWARELEAELKYVRFQRMCVTTMLVTLILACATALASR